LADLLLTLLAGDWGSKRSIVISTRSENHVEAVYVTDPIVFSLPPFFPPLLVGASLIGRPSSAIRSEYSVKPSILKKLTLSKNPDLSGRPHGNHPGILRGMYRHSSSTTFIDRNNIKRRHSNDGHGQPLGPVEIQNVSPVETETTPEDKDITPQTFVWCPPRPTTGNHPQFHGQVSLWTYLCISCHL